MPDRSLHPGCRLVVLISGSGSNLQAMIDAASEDRMKADIAAVISNRADAFGLTRASRASIPCEVLDHQGFDNREQYDATLLETISGFDPDLIVLAGFMRILSSGFVSAYTNRIMNIHPSLLPKYTGMHTHERVLDAGDEIHGATVHFVTSELDAGPIIIQGRVPVLTDDSADVLQHRIHRVEHLIYPRAIQWYATDRLSVEGDEVLYDGKGNPGKLVHCDQNGSEIP
jgi:phosphoribosylglycinamide formyltransferase-1